MDHSRPLCLVDIEYDNAAQAYLRSLSPGHSTEATPQATQRTIFLESFDLLRTQRPGVQFYNRLLVQYPFGRPPVIRQVVPDNMVVLSEKPLRAVTSFNLPVQPVWPFWVLDYVSRSGRHQDYEDRYHKYEKELKVPYFLVFCPDNQDLGLYRYAKRGYQELLPDANGRYPVPELELEVGLLDGWVRLWHRGALLSLPAELRSQLVDTRRLLTAERKARRTLEVELARLRAQLGLPTGPP
jgi:Uma2 family endonuclease